MGILHFVQNDIKANPFYEIATVLAVLRNDIIAVLLTVMQSEKKHPPCHTERSMTIPSLSY